MGLHVWKWNKIYVATIIDNSLLTISKIHLLHSGSVTPSLGLLNCINELRNWFSSLTFLHILWEHNTLANMQANKGVSLTLGELQFSGQELSYIFPSWIWCIIFLQQKVGLLLQHCMDQGWSVYGDTWTTRAII